MPVRLAGSGVSNQGRLEVYYNGVWGTVCDNSFDDVDAQVACYALGFRYAMSQQGEAPLRRFPLHRGANLQCE